MPKRFKKVFLASTNDHPKDNDKVRNWIEYQGGTYSGTELTSQTTHLLCSRSAWKMYPQIVRDGRRRRREGQRIKIVAFNWLKDSILLNNGKPLATGAFDWEQLKLTTTKGCMRQQRQSEDASQADIASTAHSFTSRLQHKESQLESHGYSLYTDSQGFTYSFALVRPDAAGTVQRLNMYISEDNGEASPQFCAVSYIVDQDGRTVAHEFVPQGSGRSFAMRTWELTFKGRTGRDWGLANNKQVSEEKAESGKWMWNGRDVVWEMLDGEGQPLSPHVM